MSKSPKIAITSGAHAYRLFEEERRRLGMDYDQFIRQSTADRSAILQAVMDYVFRESEEGDEQFCRLLSGESGEQKRD